jgi:hypothetical protein
MTPRRPKLPRLLIAAALLLAAGALLVILVRAYTHPTVNWANYDRVQIGMTRAEVHALLGEPSDGLSPLGYEDLDADERALPRSPPPPELQSWRSETHEIFVAFDARGRVVSKSYSRDPGVGWPRRVVDWLRW